MILLTQDFQIIFKRIISRQSTMTPRKNKVILLHITLHRQFRIVQLVIIEVKHIVLTNLQILYHSTKEIIILATNNIKFCHDSSTSHDCFLQDVVVTLVMIVFKHQLQSLSMQVLHLHLGSIKPTFLSIYSHYS